MTCHTDEAALARIAREIRYRDALWKIRGDLDRLLVRVTRSGQATVAAEIRQTIDKALDIGGEFGGLDA